MAQDSQHDLRYQLLALRNIAGSIELEAHPFSFSPPSAVQRAMHLQMGFDDRRSRAAIRAAIK
jgi:hypothetical protein